MIEKPMTLKQIHKYLSLVVDNEEMAQQEARLIICFEEGDMEVSLSSTNKDSDLDYYLVWLDQQKISIRIKFILATTENVGPRSDQI